MCMGLFTLLVAEDFRQHGIGREFRRWLLHIGEGHGAGLVKASHFLNYRDYVFKGIEGLPHAANCDGYFDGVYGCAVAETFIDDLETFIEVFDAVLEECC